MVFRCLCVSLVLSASAVLANEQVRQVQEELRKRNLYFGDIDGQVSADLDNALRRYQTRKGFAVTGKINAETSTSLNVQASSAGRAPQVLPDVPVLKSDLARQIPEVQRIALEKQAQENPDLVPTPPPPAESPPPSQDLNPARVTQLVEQYLRDSETSDIPVQTRYFAYPVEYFVHGSQGPAFVERDVAGYVKRWPERKYTLTGPVSFAAGSGDRETNVEFTIAYNVRNGAHTAQGRTRNFWTIRPEGEDLKITAIREQRLRE